MVEDKAVPEIKLRTGAVAAQVRGILLRWAVVHENVQSVRNIVDGMAVGIRTLNRKPVAWLLDYYNLEPLIVGGADALDLGDSVKPGIETVVDNAAAGRTVLMSKDSLELA